MSAQRKILYLFVLLIWLPAAVAAPALIPAPPAIAAKGYLLMDANSGTVLVEKNADERLEPASLTKMMTSYVADYELAQGNIALDDITTVSKNAWAKNFPGSSLMFLEVGKKVSVENLLKGVIISSGNDATVALAEHIAGSTSAFTDIMNQHAELLGMFDTQFRNPHGLPKEGHYTTARDMATLGRAIIRDFPAQYGYYSQKSYTFNGIKQLNRNKLLWRDDSVDGLKTGHTSRAGYCLVASAKKDDMRLIAVVMGAKSEESRAREAQKLLSYGFRYYKTLKLYDEGEMVQKVKVWAGDKEELALVTEDDVYITVPRAQKDDVDARMEIDQFIEAPVEAGKTYGELVIGVGEGEPLMKVPLVASSTVESGGFVQVIWDKIQLFFYQMLEG
ncbi:D-alanyl-D-alanine carboxypeptidase DacC [BD1-7 clade bacterium]|uniref:serine-type D-Ala-D-Ala carboxypeptidase n=1 Tax=BD1-7 clade bacterium TaxID=2029982 RepID=A0A5S9PWJ6_9GAMM|nr:D-alanyl-D-alanine carboxypeptidase DacC [BD1-7 clade bacterium]CAA0108912.1 D-alanyl-D-alanine carboxypeptidase DacC [BD1-7 clade bacterium]